MIVSTISFVLDVYWYCLLARILMSYFPDVEHTRIGRFLLRITEPYLTPFRRVIPPLGLGGVYIDLSSVVALIAFYFVEQGVLFLLANILGAFGLY